jgi:RHS repeat-associated protein
MNAFGEPISVTDNGGTITYDYYSSGLPKSITANGSTISMTYDIHGNRDTLNDPDAGQIVSAYNAFDELTSQTDARGNTYTMLYDVLGRMYQRSGPYGELTTWTYENTVAGKLGTLTSVALNNGTSQSYSYDVLGRITSQTESTGSQSFTKTYTYDSYGRVQYENWHTGFGIRNVYNSYGYLSEVKTQDNETVWASPAYNARGQVTAYNLGTNHVSRSWDTYGFPTKILTKDANDAVVLELQYDFDEKRGNLKQRKLTSGTYIIEDFRYDGLNRLVADSLSSTDYRNTDYADNGNIEERTDIGIYNYGAQNTGPHAVTSLSNTTGTLLPTTSQAVDYTPFNKAFHITQGNKDYFITYGPDRLRTKTSLQSGIGDDVLLTKYYAFGDFEKETDADGTRQLHYISGGDGLAAIYVKYDTGADSLYYVMQDHLGSLVGAINSESNHVCRQSFDAWGRARNPENWTYTNIPDEFPFLRGYTGHEHLKWFGLINMNGRMYDAGLCRFLSPDPYVQMPDNSQNFNRYSYCLNNPLVYTDPSGEIIWMPIIIGAAIGSIQGYMIGNQVGLTGWELVGTTLAGAGIGALSGGVGTSVAASSGVVAGAVTGGAISGAGMGLTTGIATGQDLGTTLGMTFSGGLQGGILGLAGGAVGGAIGGGWGAFAGGATAGGLGAAMNGGSGEDILKGAALGGVMGFGLYHGSLVYSYHKSGIKSTGLSYNQYAKMIAVTQRSIFWNREGKFIPNSKGGVNVSKLGGENSVGVTGADYSDALLDYHTHQEFGYDKFSTAQESINAYGTPQYSDEFTRGQLNTRIRYKGPMYLGTREGNIHYMNSNFSRGTLNYNFSHVFTPFNMAWTLSLIK